MEHYIDKKITESTNSSTILHPYVREGNHLIKQSHSESSFPPYINELESWRRQTSKSSLPTGVLTQGVNVDFEINSTGGHITTMYIELNLKENNIGNATISPYQVWERIEIYVNNGQDLFRIIYPDENYFLRMLLQRNFISHRTKRNAEYLNANYTPTAGNLPQNTSQTFLLEFDLFDGAQPDFRLLTNGLLCRFYFNQSTYFCDPTCSTNV